MLTVKQLLECIQPGDWMTSIDLIDVYFHVPILPCQGKFLHFMLAGKSYQSCRLPLIYSLAPHTFSKTALAPPSERAVGMLTYIDDWLILATSKQEV